MSENGKRIKYNNWRYMMEAFKKQPLSIQIVIGLDVVLYMIGVVLSCICVVSDVEMYVLSIALIILGVAGVIAAGLSYKTTGKSAISNGVISLIFILIGIVSMILKYCI